MRGYANGTRLVAWNATVCLVHASAETPKCVRPSVMRPKHRPTMRAKKPGGVHAGPSCIAQYGKGDVGPQILRRRRGFGGDVSRDVA